MKHTECEDCELSQGDCGHHFKSEIYSNTGITTNYDIASLSACDQYGNCMFFKSKAKLKGDLISREALEEVINDLFRSGEYDCNSVLIAIDNAPAVGPKQGEWIQDNLGDRFCSECGGYALYHELGLKIESRFCPNCGAYMKGGAE